MQYLSLAKSKGVHRELESEGSWRQTFGPTNKGTGEFGSAGRTFNNAKNLNVYRKDAWYNPRGATQFFDLGMKFITVIINLNYGVVGCI